MGEMTKTSVKYCRKCKYSYNHSQTEIMCGYYSKTGLRRGCPLMLLKNTLIRNGVSIALVGSEDTGKDDGCIMFF